MPIQFSIDRTKDLTVFTLTGEVSFADLLRTLNEYGKNKPTRFELYDARQINGERLTSDQMQNLSGYLSQYANTRPAESKTVIVVSQTIDFGLSRMVSLLTDGQVPYTIEVCNTLEEAYETFENS